MIGARTLRLLFSPFGDSDGPRGALTRPPRLTALERRERSRKAAATRKAKRRATVIAKANAMRAAMGMPLIPERELDL
jgi:hypothetical protein